MRVMRNTFCGDSVKARFWKEAPSSYSFCRRGHLVQFIEQENQPYSGVEWNFACLMRTKRRHRAGASAPQPPRTPLALLDELHKLAYVHVNTKSLNGHVNAGDGSPTMLRCLSANEESQRIIHGIDDDWSKMGKMNQRG